MVIAAAILNIIAGILLSLEFVFSPNVIREIDTGIGYGLSRFRELVNLAILRPTVNYPLHQPIILIGMALATIGNWTLFCLIIYHDFIIHHWYERILLLSMFAVHTGYYWILIFFDNNYRVLALYRDKRFKRITALFMCIPGVSFLIFFLIPVIIGGLFLSLTKGAYWIHAHSPKGILGIIGFVAFVVSGILQLILAIKGI
jgi:hypothetical protein